MIQLFRYVCFVLLLMTHQQHLFLPHKILHSFACIIWIMAKRYVKVNNSCRLQQEKFNSYKHESIYIKKILNDINLEFWKPGEQKNQLILLLVNLKQWKIIQRLIKSLYLTPGSKLGVPSGISLSPNLKWRKF